jgi:hypothetical protein
VESMINDNTDLQPLKPARLTMKILNARIDQIQEENKWLTQRVTELEQLLRHSDTVQSYTAAASETSIHLQPTHEVPDNWTIPRSVRHPIPEKKSFWTKLFG